MSKEKLKREIDSGIEFYGWFKKNALLGVMSIQFVKSVTLIRHVYVLPEYQRRGIGSKLLRYLTGLAKTSDILVGTW
ncbi:MAG: GNAT family N-acetyltransferase, partial [Thaumarchaeota archaeon]